MWTKNNIKSLAGKTAIVTGANSGIGFQTAMALFQHKCHVVVAGRNLDAVEKAIAEMKKQSGSGSLEAGLIDLASLESVKVFAENFKANHDTLDILVNNAAVMLPPPGRTVEGFELQFGVNFLGHFALTGWLYPVLRSTAGARVVNLTSLAYTIGEIDFDNFRLEKEYDASREYNQSKLANMMFTLELQNRINEAGDDMFSLAANPGVAQTNLTRYMSREAIDAAIQQFGELMTPEQGALSALYAAVADDVAKGGFYSPDQDGGMRGYPASAAIQSPATDKSTAVRLWRFAEEVTGIKYPQR